MTIFEKISGYFKDSREKNFEIRKLKAANSKDFNWTTFSITFLIIFALIVGIAASVIYFSVNAVSNTLESAITKNPELAFLALSEEYSTSSQSNMELLAILSVAKQVSMETKGSIDMNFKGYFTTKDVRELQKVNLSCIDDFEYFDISGNLITPENDERLKDEQCIKYFTENTENSTTGYYKCPKFNCATKEVISKQVDQFIPDYITVSHIDANLNSGNNKG